MIVLAGIPSEPPIALAAASADALGLPCVVLNQRAFAFDGLDLRFADGRCSGSLTVAGQRHPLASIAGIYLRTMDTDSLPELQAAPQARQRAHAWEETLQAWTEVAPQRVANRISLTLSNFSKPYQMQAIRAAGFAVPDTLATNDPAAVHAFRARHGKVIYKSASSVRSIVRLLDDAALKKLDAIRALPTQFQAYIGGENVRVHVVGTRTFAVRIVSDAVDYRYAGRDGLDVDMVPFDLPDDVAARCVGLSARLGLPFCGIDFKVQPGGAYVCFEVNPSPAYSYYQELTGVPISDALVRYLAGQD
jgi:glutathione synthase/RimK-type ligase-like ATP-grasp enzyme